MGSIDQVIRWIANSWKHSDVQGAGKGAIRVAPPVWVLPLLVAWIVGGGGAVVGGAHAAEAYGSYWAALGPDARVITVSASGGADHTTIQAALVAAELFNPPPTEQAPIVVLVLPGFYPEQGLVVPDWVSLIGTNVHSCIIEYASTTYDGTNSPTSALVSAPWNSEIANLTIHNTRTSYSSVCLALGYDTDWLIMTAGNRIRVHNVHLYGAAFDELCIYGDNDIRIDSAVVEDFGYVDTLSAVVPAGATFRVTNSRFLAAKSSLWLTGDGTIEFQACRFDALDASNAIIWNGNVGTSLTARFQQCSFKNGVSAGITNASGGNNFTLVLEHSSYNSLGTAIRNMPAENLGNGARSTAGAWTFSGSTTFSGVRTSQQEDVLNGGARMFSAQPVQWRFWTTGDGFTAPKLTLTGRAGSLYEGYSGDLLPGTGAGAILRWTGIWDAFQGLQTGGVERISADGVFTGSGAGLTDISASAIASGTLSAARLPANVAYRDASTTFADTTVSGRLTAADTSATTATVDTLFVRSAAWTTHAGVAAAATSTGGATAASDFESLEFPAAGAAFFPLRVSPGTIIDRIGFRADAATAAPANITLTLLTRTELAVGSKPPLPASPEIAPVAATAFAPAAVRGPASLGPGDAALWTEYTLTPPITVRNGVSCALRVDGDVLATSGTLATTPSPAPAAWRLYSVGYRTSRRTP